MLAIGTCFWAVVLGTRSFVSRRAAVRRWTATLYSAVHSKLTDDVLRTRESSRALDFVFI